MVIERWLYSESYQRSKIEHSVLQIRDFQLVGQWAEGLNYFSWEIIVINWIDIMNTIFKKRIIRRSYPNIHLHINYVRSFQEICIYFDRARHPNGRQSPMTGHYLQRWHYVCLQNIPCSVLRRFWTCFGF